MKTTIDNSGDLFDEIKLQIERSKREREELNKRHKSFFEKREEISKHMTDLDKEVYRLESQREGYEEASEKQINYMWEEYELTLNHAKEHRNPNLTDLADMKRRIQELKGEIRALGNVNVNAIEEYKSVSERYEFLKGQHDDLVEAAESLEQIIEELDSAMRKLFIEQFAELQPSSIRYSRKCSEAEKERWNLWKMRIFWRRVSGSLPSRLERSCRI